MIKTIIVDDEPMVAEIIRYFVKKGDLPLDIVGTADNGIIAEELIRKYQPDLVFLDIQMPMKNGFEVMRDQPDTKYVIVTAFDTFDYAQRALRLGAMDILLKPIDYEQLKQSVSRVVGWNFTANDTVNDIVEYINHHYAEDISLTDLSEQFFLTSSHIARLFKKYMGESVINYVNRVRIDSAKVLLDKGMSVKNVSEAVGYHSLNNFYKHFRKLTETTPAAYCSRKGNRG